jgi:26S proteasome regulatory subunit N10
VFVGSPIADSAESLERLGRKLKKNNVAVDVVNFGEDAENAEKLGTFVGSVDNSSNSWVRLPTSAVQR